MRAILIIAIVAVLGFFGYEYFAKGNDPQAVISRLTGTMPEADAAATDAAASVDATAEDAAAATAAAAAQAEAEAQAAAEKLAKEADEAAAAAAAEAAAAADQAATAATDAAAAVAGAVEQLGEDANAAAADLIQDAADATPTGDAAPEAAPAADAAATADAEVMDPAQKPLTELLTPEGFDADAVVARINESDLSAIQKTALTAATNAVRDNPDLLQATLTRLREAMGL